MEIQVIVNDIVDKVVTILQNEASNILYSMSSENMQMETQPTVLFKKRSENFQFELLSATSNESTFYKGCLWSPDGLCIMTNSDDNYIRLYNTPHNILSKNWTSLSENTELKPCLKIMEAETIYDYIWWPLMNSMYPSTCCLATTCRDQPTHLWDAFDGKLRATYIAKNSVDDVKAANSLSFSPDGTQLLCGYKRELRLFYTDLPGEKCEVWKTKKQKGNGQNGIISKIAYNPDGSMFACASYDKTIGLYSSTNGQLLDLYTGHEGGVTHLQFSLDGNRLYSGGRNDSCIKCWDIRHSSTVCNFNRTVNTNQRIYFDLNYNGKDEITLISGNTDGNISLWNVEDISNESFYNNDNLFKSNSVTYKANNDCVNGVSVHPYLPVLATCSGQRHFLTLDSDSSDDNEEIKSCDYNKGSIENNLKIWHLLV